MAINDLGGEMTDRDKKCLKEFLKGGLEVSALLLVCLVGVLILAKHVPAYISIPFGSILVATCSILSLIIITK